MTFPIKTYITTAIVAIGAVLLTACSSDSDDDGGGSPSQPDTTAPLSIRLTVPETDDTTTKSRIGDPGADGDETAEWDRLTVIVAYTDKKSGEGISDSDPSKMVYWDTFTRTEFDNATDVVMHQISKLSPPNSSGYHDVTMYLPQGKCKLYAVAYCKGAGLDIEAMLNNISQDGQDHNAEVQNLTIPGDYASGNAKQMQMVIGVGTGYAVKVDKTTGTAVSPEERTMEVVMSGESSSESQYWRLIVQRLAAKIDLQWDSQSAYDINGSQYDYIGVTGYTYYTGTTHPLFPALTTLSHVPSAVLESNLLKVDDTEISQHNGRTEFYIFPDGITPDQTETLNSTYVKYTVTSKKTAESAERTLYYNFKLPKQVQPGTWYKINTDIKGNSESSVDGTSKVIILSKTN